MIATDRFVYIHLHKSGGTFINECLLRFFPDARQLGYHLPCRMIPENRRQLPVLGFVRNPWSYYVSWYSFQSSMAVGNPLYRHARAGGTLNFKDTVRNLLDLGRDGAKLDRLLQDLPEAYGTKGLNLPRAALAPIRGSNLGFYAYLFQYMFAGYGGSLHLKRAENLRQEFLDFLASRSIDVSDELRQYVMTEGARNPSEHRPYAEYYDAELEALVAERDRPVVSSFGYVFGA